jgi:hypothetical protein
MAARGGVTPVTIEAVEKKAFATAVDWPGWSRSGRTEEGALAALAVYAPRYAEVAALAHKRFPAHPEFSVVERVTGDGSTSFGVPGVVTRSDHAPLTAAGSKSRLALLQAAWEYFAQVAAGAPAVLRKGPRGGGRDTDQMVRHVLEAESGYARQLGIKMPAPASVDDWGDLHRAMRDVLGSAPDGQPIAGKRWTARYATHRIAWHVLDHAWEMQDKSEPSP